MVALIFILVGILLPYFITLIDLLFSVLQSKVTVYNSTKQAEINQILLKSEELMQPPASVMGFVCNDDDEEEYYDEDYDEDYDD